MPKLELDERIALAREAMNEAAAERLARADAIWHPDDEEVRTLVSRWSWRPNYTKPLKVSAAILGGIVFLASLWYVLYILGGGTL